MAYGSTDGLILENKIKPSPVHFASVLICFLVPPLVFTAVASPLCFQWHFRDPQAVWVGVFVGGSIPFLIAMFAANRMKKSGGSIRWPLFTAFTLLLAWVAGMCFGDQNYWFSLQQFYAAEALKTYPNVDPAKYSGTQLMDAGRVYFAKDTVVDIDKGMAFTHYHTYCVAPIIKQGAALEFYDLWAIGRDCCTTDDPQFNCVYEADPGPLMSAKLWNITQAQARAENPKIAQKSQDSDIRAGLRDVSDPEKLFWHPRGDEQLFYRLAVTMAEAAYNLKTQHPIFFRWVKDPDKEVRYKFEVGYKLWIFGNMIYFCVNLVFIILFLFFHGKH